MWKRLRAHSRGQSIVEFALSAIILAFLLAAAVDVGLIFYAQQQLRNAVKEGLLYGAYLPSLPNPSDPGNPLPNNTGIRYRIRLQAGDPSTKQASIVFVNLLDLNNNGTPDDQEGGYGDGSVLGQYIQIEDYEEGTNAPCPKRTRNCWLRISMSYDYKLIFPLAPVFADTYRINVIQEQQIVRSFQ